MMQLLCDGVLLDLYDNAGLQFTHENPLFAFDKLSCERTTQFKLPSTPKNDRVFALARIPAYDGVGMRRKFTAQLQAGTIVKDGYLYIGSYDGKDYNAIFVTGELVRLQDISSLGKLKDIMDYSETIAINANVKSPYEARNELWSNVRYSHPTGSILRPSMSLQLLYESICTQYALNAQAFPSQLANMRIVSTANGVKEDQEFKCTIDPAQESAQPDSTTPSTRYNTLEYDSRLFQYQDVSYGVAVLNTGGTASNQYYLVRVYKAKTALKLTMPDDMPITTHIYDFVNLDFVGDYSFDKDFDGTITRVGDPLAGRTIEVNTGDTFAFVDEGYYVYRRQIVMGTTYYDRGFFFDQSPTFNTDWIIGVESKNEPLVNGDLCRLQDNLPDITFTDLLKTIAALCGCVLNYSEEDGLTFDPIDINTFSSIDVSRLTKRGEVSKKFSNYAQNNIIHFSDNEEDVNYTIDNDNIEPTNDLLKLPFAKGASLNNSLYIQGDSDQQYIGADGGGSMLVVYDLPKCAGLQALCDASTQFDIEARMYLLEYNAITAKTLLLVDGTRYLWTKRSWQKDLAKFTLAKV